MPKKFIFKITPNKKDVIINTDVLNNGYLDVSYPIPFKNTTLIGYVLDPDTFKFVDDDTFKYDSKPYPVRIEIISKFEDLPFYGVNKELNEDKILYYGPILLNNIVNDKGTYDEAIYVPSSSESGRYTSEGYIASYTIIVNIYWSDNKSHASDINYTLQEATINGYPLMLEIQPELLNEDFGNILTRYYKTPASGYQANPFITIKDNTVESIRDVLRFNIYVTVTEPNTLRSVMKNDVVTVSLAAYPGKRIGYLKLEYKDTVPIEVWSPDVSIYFAKSINNEANPKLDKDSFSEYFGFSVNGDLNITNRKKQYISNRYLYFDGALPFYVVDENGDITDETLSLDNLSEALKNILQAKDSSYQGRLYCKDVIIDNFYLDTYYNTEDLDQNKLSVINYDSSSVFSDKDLLDFEERFQACASIEKDSKLNEVLQTPENDILQVKWDTDDVLKDISTDLYITKSKYRVIIKGKYKAKYAKYYINNNEYQQVLKVLYELPRMGRNENLMVEPLSSASNPEENNNSENNTENILYGANPANEIINQNQLIPAANTNAGINMDANINENMEQINVNDFVIKNYIIQNNSKDVDIAEYYNKLANQIPNSFILESDPNNDISENFSNFKVILTEKNISVQSKYCVNNLLNNNTQIPRFGIYPIYYGLIPILYSAYDYTSNEIPCNEITGNYNILYRDNGIIKINKDELEKYQQNILNNEGIIDIDNTISTITNVTNPYIDKISYKDREYAINGGKINRSLETAGSYSTTTTNTNTSQATLLMSAGNSELYSAGTQQKIILNNVPDSLKDVLRINGIKLEDLNSNNSNNYTFTSNVSPAIFVISLDEYPDNLSACIDVTGAISGKLILTNDENEKHLIKYENEGHDINTDHNSYMLLRTNPKLTGNVKLVISSDYNLYLDTFKATHTLSNSKYRKYPISADGNYPRDIKTVFKDLPPTELFAIPENSLKAHKIYTDFNDQYETMYEYGAETNKDNLYSENMKILAPLHIGKDIPGFFAIFRYDKIFNKETYNSNYFNDITKFKDLIKEAKVILTYDLRNYTSIGQYLNNYRDMLNFYGQCYLQFIELDNDLYSPSYRQGNNIWKGISVKRGILTDQSESSYFSAKILNNKFINKQELYNNFIMSGFERHDLLYPNIINLEFMFNDPDSAEYSIHNYFGLYLTENDFIKYGYIISDNITQNNYLKKYDKDGNLYVNDNDIYKQIFTNTYKDRIFYAITNNETGRIQSDIDLNNFFTNYVKNKPESNLTSIKSDYIKYNEKDKSFITLHFKLPLKYGEHIKIIAMNKPIYDKTYTNIGENSSNNILPYEHIVYEIIASNDERLRYTDNYINPYVNTQKCVYSENTYFYRISFYSQNTEYPEISATIEDQIKRIIACILKFDTFIYVGSHDSTSMSIISEYDEMYLQHIAAPDLNAFKFDFVNLTAINSTLYTTNKNYTSSIDFMKYNDISTNIDIYDQKIDDKNDWININKSAISTTENAVITNWRHYVEVEDPVNIKEDNISYFNKNITYNMYALTNQSDYFEGYYTPFSNYSFETLGWRHNSIVKFLKISELTYSYILYDNIDKYIDNVKFPLTVTLENTYENLDIITINHGYIRNNIYDPDNFKNYINEDTPLIFKSKDVVSITSPYDVRYSMIATLHDALLLNKIIRLYKPKAVNIAIMGISNVKDIDTCIDLNRIYHNETNLTVSIPAFTTILLDESDYRLLHAVLYEFISGTMYINNTQKLNKGDKFIVIKDENNKFNVYVSGIANPVICTSFITKSNVVYKVADKQNYQSYNYNTLVPTNETNNFYIDPLNTKGTELNYPIVPLVNCTWKSNGEYFDQNNILDVKSLTNTYNCIGNFTENVYTPGEYLPNQYISNRIDSVLYVDEKKTNYKDIILNNVILHPIKNLLIDNVNIETASAYYNTNIQCLEFIFSGIKFTIKLNSKIVNTFIHLDSYTDFEVFVINDYDLTKRNELYISLVEKFILLVNHQFYINYKHEAYNQIKVLNNNDYTGYADYSVFRAPYNIDFQTALPISNANHFISHIKEIFNDDSLYDVIDKYNLWTSYYLQYDIPNKNILNTEPQYIQSKIEAIFNHDNYITFDKHRDDNIGILNNKQVVNLNTDDINILSTISDSLSYVLTKADGDYNHQAYTLISHINNKINDFENNTGYGSRNLYGASSIHVDINPANMHINTNTNTYANIPEANDIAVEPINMAETFDRYIQKTAETTELIISPSTVNDDINNLNSDVNTGSGTNTRTGTIINNEYINRKVNDLINDSILPANIQDQMQVNVANDKVSVADFEIYEKNKEDNLIISKLTNTNNTEFNNDKKLLILTTNNNKGFRDKVTFNEARMKMRLSKNDRIQKLSDLLDTPVFRAIFNQNASNDDQSSGDSDQSTSSGETTYKNIIIPKTYLDELQEFIKKIIILENDKERLERYVKSFDDNIDIYIIPNNNEYRYIKNTNEYNPLIFKLSVPNRIKFNYGWFTPNTNNMINFYVNDPLQKILKVDLLQSNTYIKGIETIKNYTGNKVFDDTLLQTLDKNYFIIPERSLLSCTWDNNYYRKYTSENNFVIKEGHITGIDDKSFFGSTCMVIQHEYIQLDTWKYRTANDIYTFNPVSSNFNIKDTNVNSMELIINLNAAMYNHFINNKNFVENWNFFKNSQYTGMKNYINQTIIKAYNMNSNIDIKLYYKRKAITDNINIENTKPVDFNSYDIYEGYTSKIIFKNDIYSLKITIPETTGKQIYPVIKIYRK